MSTNQMILLLQKKTELFTAFLQITEEMCSGSSELLASNMEKRLALQKQIEAVDRTLSPLLQTDPQAGAAAAMQCNYGGLDAEYAAVYDAAFQLHGILAIIQSLEPHVKLRLQQERDRLLEKIEQTQKSPAAAASRYYQSAHMQPLFSPHGSSFGKA